ncbi:MAG: VOC family protein [Gammaproteobacteria bacterium]|nr:VOC family protein [Gammaproteobacteria bacterium]
MIDHIGIEVSNYEKSKLFYEQALAPLGYQLLMEVAGFAGFGMASKEGPIASFWLHQGENPGTKTHIAFSASDREAVNQFYLAAIKNGGTDNGKPGIREIYHPNYYGAFVLDPDGFNIEAVCHKP